MTGDSTLLSSFTTTRVVTLADGTTSYVSGLGTAHLSSIFSCL